MHFTLWPSLTGAVGGYGEISWEIFRGAVLNPTVNPDRQSLEGWSPAKFEGNRRAHAATEAVSCIVLDDDASGLPLERVAEIWSFAAGLIHTTHSHTIEAPRYRIVLRASRDMNADEHARVWRAVRDVAAQRGQTLDEATKDPSRFWFVPARRSSEAPYDWKELHGEPLPVDAILAAEPVQEIRTEAAKAPSHSPPADTRRAAMAAALGAAWPAKGRHEAQRALAGALRAEGFPEDEALDFLCAVCAAAGDEDRAKRAKTIEHTYALAPDAPMTSWSRLKLHIDPVIVDAARGALGRSGEWTEAISRRLAAAVPERPALVVPAGERVQLGAIAFDHGGYNAELPPISWQVEGLIARGDVVMFVAHGNSLKTWLAFSLAQAVASGKPWLGRYVVQRGRAAVIDFESGAYEVLRRMKLLGVRDELVGDRLLRASYPSALLTDPEVWVGLAGGLDFVSVDSFNAASPNTDENDARSALMLQYAGRFAEHTGSTVLFVHHARKGAGEDDREAVRGSTALYAACDRVFKFDDIERRDGGIVLSTMKSIKDGAGRSPPDVRVELSDQGLRCIDIAPTIESPAVDLDEENRRIVFGVLGAKPAGVEKNDLLAVMHGQAGQRREFLAQLKLANVIVEYREPTGGRGQPKIFVMIKAQ